MQRAKLQIGSLPLAFEQVDAENPMEHGRRKGTTKESPQDVERARANSERFHKLDQSFSEFKSVPDAQVAPSDVEIRLETTAELVSLSLDYYTAWNYRRRMAALKLCESPYVLF